MILPTAHVYSDPGQVFGIKSGLVHSVFGNMLRQKPLDQMTQFEQQRMVFLLNEMDRINRDNQTVIQKFILKAIINLSMIL